MQNVPAHSDNKYEALRAYRAYLVYVEWTRYLDEKTLSNQMVKMDDLQKSIAVLQCLQLDKKRVFTQTIHAQNDTAVLNELREAARKADRTDDLHRYAEGLLLWQKNKVSEKETELLAPIRGLDYWKAQGALAFSTQFSFQLGVSISAGLNDAMTSVEGVGILKEPLSREEMRMLQNAVGVTYVLINLLMSGWMGYSYELASTVSRVFLNQTNLLFSSGNYLDHFAKAIPCSPLSLLPEPERSTVTSYFRLDEIGVIEKEPLLAFFLSLLIHLSVSSHPNRLATGLTYMLVMGVIGFAMQAMRFFLPRQAKDTHFYKDEEIEDLLKHDSKGKDAVFCFTPMLGSTTVRGNDVVENLVDFNEGRRNVMPGKRHIIVPVNIRLNHWVLMQLHYKVNTSMPFEISYFDSLGAPVPKDLADALQAAGFPECTLLYPKRVQTDGYHCGTWVAYIAKLSMEGDEEGLGNLHDVNIDDIRVQQMKQLHPKENPHMKKEQQYPWLTAGLHILIYIFLYPHLLKKTNEFFPIDGVLTEGRALRLLGLHGSANTTEVKKACRELSRQYHPDKNIGREKEVLEQFIPIRDACDFLTGKRSNATFG
jgi:hypothetical protein